MAPEDGRPGVPLSVDEMNLRLRLGGWQVAGASVRAPSGPGRYVVVASRGAQVVRVEGDGAVAAWSEAYRRAEALGRGEATDPNPKPTPAGGGRSAREAGELDHG